MRVYLFTIGVRALLRLNLEQLESIIEPAKAPGTPAWSQIERIVHCIDQVFESKAPLIRRGCYSRGVICYYLLRRAGLEVSLYFGVSKRGEHFAGHCWLMRNGEPFLERNDPRPQFTTVYAIPRSTIPSGNPIDPTRSLKRIS
ncbi:MAG TPA: lasso peptide biosynthesis B2 protein [Chloroflexota bacterium]|nr:lasso peptide biosynthesis B2 protein [Chloroflexota bacterium]